MAKKGGKAINPKDQSEELRRAKLELLMRNPVERQKLMILIARHKKRKGEITTGLASVGGHLDPKLQNAWEYIFSQTEAVFDNELAEYIRQIDPPSAVQSVWRWADYNMELQYTRMADRRNYKGGPPPFTYEDLNRKVLDMYCRDAEGIFVELTNGRPAVHLLLGVDLTRSKQVILAEVGELVDEYRSKIGVLEKPEQRFKWLSIADDLFRIWDLRDEGLSFGKIARKENLRTKGGAFSADTARKRFYKAFELIYGLPYTANIFRDLFRESLGFKAKEEKTTDQKFWKRVAKAEEVPQGRGVSTGKIDTLHDAATDNETPEAQLLRREQTLEPRRETMLITGIRNICLRCSDRACRTNMLIRLEKYKIEGDKAFKDFHPDCPKIYAYLTQE